LSTFRAVSWVTGMQFGLLNKKWK